MPDSGILRRSLGFVTLLMAVLALVTGWEGLPRGRRWKR